MQLLKKDEIGKIHLIAFLSGMCTKTWFSWIEPNKQLECMREIMNFGYLFDLESHFKPVVLTKPYVQILLIDILDRKYL
jgi:hypothetical protein